MGRRCLISQSGRASRSLLLDELFRYQGLKQPLTHIFDKCTLPPSHARARSHMKLRLFKVNIKGWGRNLKGLLMEFYKRKTNNFLFQGIFLGFKRCIKISFKVLKGWSKSKCTQTLHTQWSRTPFLFSPAQIKWQNNSEQLTASIKFTGQQTRWREEGKKRKKTSFVIFFYPQTAFLSSALLTQLNVD